MTRMFTRFQLLLGEFSKELYFLAKRKIFLREKYRYFETLLRFFLKKILRNVVELHNAGIDNWFKNQQNIVSIIADNG